MSYTIKSISPTRFTQIPNWYTLGLNAAFDEVEARRQAAQKAGRTETVLLVDEHGRTIRKAEVWVPSKAA